MYSLPSKLLSLEESNNPIRVGIVGIGQQGRGLVAQLLGTKGMRPVIICDIDLSNATSAFSKAGLSNECFIITNKDEVADQALLSGKFVVTEDMSLIARSNFVDVVVEATGVPEIGAKFAYKAIHCYKHVVMLNVETDVTIGPLLKRYADQKDVVYTGSAGDEPGAVIELFNFSTVLGFDVRILGKGQNHKIDRECTPDKVADEASKFNMNPKMLCSFKEGSKTMVELTAIANATGLICDVRGAHGPSSNIDGLNQIFLLKSEGGILNRYGVVDYVNGVAPGVFAIVSHKDPEINESMCYMRMGNGPNYTLFRPYHLCSLETPLSIAAAVIEKAPTIVSKGKPICETIAIAKRDLKTGEMLDSIGGYTVYGMIEIFEKAKEIKALPLGLVNSKTKVIRDIKKGEVIDYSSVQLDSSSFIAQLRAEQDKTFA